MYRTSDMLVTQSIGWMWRKGRNGLEVINGGLSGMNGPEEPDEVKALGGEDSSFPMGTWE